MRADKYMLMNSTRALSWNYPPL